jgi:type IV pilus assembly protein PilV
MRHPFRTRIAGFSLIEVLIALVILSVGLLGIAAMVSVSLKSKDSSYYRTEALTLASSILDRMRANSAIATANGYDTTYSATIGTAPSNNCTGGTCSTADIATMDLSQWKTEISNALPGFSSGTPAGGKIVTSTVNQMTQVNISIRWNDARANSAVAASGAPSVTTATIQITSGL